MKLRGARRAGARGAVSAAPATGSDARARLPGRATWRRTEKA